VDEAAAGASPPCRRQGWPQGRLTFAARCGHARRRRPRLPCAHASPQGRRPRAHGDPGAGRERAGYLGQRAIVWAPFGVDYTAYAQSPTGAARHNEETLAPFALNYRRTAPIARELARLSFEGKLHTAVEEKDEHTQTIDLGRWKAVVTYGVPAFGFGRDPRGNPEPVGRALVGELGEDLFLVAGYFCRVDLRLKDPGSGAQREYVRVEEGGYEEGTFRPVRIWNGDETDRGLNFSSAPQVLRVSLGTY
jgi:hypothetical protein